MVLKYRATMPGNKAFLREYEVLPGTKLYKFHEFIRCDLDFAPDQMVVFEALDAEGVLCSEYGLFDMGDGSMDSVRLEDTLSRGEICLHYVFDLKGGRFLVLDYVSQVEETPRTAYPRTVLEKGTPPGQFGCDEASFGDFPETESVYEAEGATEED